MPASCLSPIRVHHGRVIKAIRNFIREELRLEVDTWNLELYGSLQYRDPDTREPYPVVDSYPGKSVIFLGNSFQFFEKGQRTVLDLCDPRILANVLAKGTNCVFLEMKDLDGFEQLAKSSIFDPRYKVEEIDQTLVSSDRFGGLSQMIASLQDGKQKGVANSLHHSFPVRKGTLRTPSVKKLTRRISRNLAKSLPSDRCMVMAPVAKGEAGSFKAAA
jgi:hypothetical protein